MRTEYSLKITDSKGKISYNNYGAKKYAEENFERVAPWYRERGGNVEFYEVQYIGNSLYKAEKIG